MHAGSAVFPGFSWTLARWAAGCAIAASTCDARAEVSSAPPARCRVESHQGEVAERCDGVAVLGLCWGKFYADVHFQAPFPSPPHVVVTPHEISRPGGCARSGTDKLHCYPDRITGAGFRMYCFGSPPWGSCGDYHLWATVASGNWLAAESDPACGTASQHAVVPRACEGAFFEELCNGSFTTRVNFADSGAQFTVKPNVVTAPERFSDQIECVADTSDSLNCYPRDLSPAGFDLVCSGSPARHACLPYSGWATHVQAGWLAMADEHDTGCHAESQHDLVADRCDGVFSPVGTCSEPFRKDIVFGRPFATPPEIIVTPEHVSDGPLCAAGGTDYLLCFAERVTAGGATVVCSGSPVHGECGGKPGKRMYSTAKFGYLAVAPSCSPR